MEKLKHILYCLFITIVLLPTIIAMIITILIYAINTLLFIPYYLIKYKSKGFGEWWSNIRWVISELIT